MGSAAKRRKSGCWTCRLRRKKCEEGGPPCLTCVNRHIHCHGYGPKPEWKDKGEKERQEAIRLRISSAKTSAPDTEAPQATMSTPSSSPAAEDVRLIVSHAADSILRINTCNEDGTSDIDFALEGEFGLMSTTNLDPLIFPDDEWNYFDPGIESYGTPVNHEHPITNENNHFEDNNIPRLINLPVSKCEHCLDHRSSEREMDLVMHYVDHTSNKAQESRGRGYGSSKGWLLSTLLRSPELYNAALSLSAYHQHLSATAGSETGSIAWHDYEKYRLRARQIFEGSQPGDPSKNFVCAVELTRLEALGGNWERSQGYLHCALSLLENPHMQNGAVSTNSPRNTGLITPTSQTCFSTGTVVTSLKPPELPSASERKALNCSRALLAWMDVLTCSAQRTVPGSHEVYRHLLSDDEFCISFQAVTGCESWVLQTIMDVVMLDSWKRDQETRRSLSIRELVRRADEIACAIKGRETSDSGANPGLHGPLSLGFPGRHGHSPGQSLTLLYARAALVYLNFIVSGPNSGAHEIRQSIDSAITVWKSVPCFHEHRLLVWPLLITAKLAQGRQTDFFRNLMGSCPEIHAPGNHYDVWSVITTCWGEGDQQVGTEQIGMDSWGNISGKHVLGLLIA
ncbi:PRO1A C6 Zink-finger protein [Colletotrichum graminicola]|nr:PRO1A C6 Zink-finger protein [Colletotrichum graminicola]